MESEHYNSEIIANFTNARTMEWLLLSSPMPIIFILLAYLYVVYFTGPQFMENRQPYSLKRFIQCYNLFQIVANFWLVFNVMTDGRPFTAVWRYCESLDKICGRNSEKQLKIMWWTLLLKIIDLIETIIFVLRKKDRQVSFLHTYHHISTVIYAWTTLRHSPHSFLMTIIALNCSIHVIMYSYYCLSTFGSNMQRRLLPFKKWITLIQMVHIAFITVGSSQGFILNCGNISVKYFSIATFLNGIVNLSLFSNFYNSYKKSKT
ncbi:Elongation of very long chain fatty acids protein [Temnothorax longispinosus]|uniref:Elongation of very long chain fatty acids protein n=1 Tax=Temnothorax longispinosus TaxID=300112 RepID=A0A4S2JTY3_9HYME|nr:Elongation of very long chain fatty acids protein [Temnothorax longispinosus]